VDESSELLGRQRVINFVSRYTVSYFREITLEKKLRSQMLIDFAKLQGYEEDQLKKLEEVLARAKDVDEAIKEFRRFKGDIKKGIFHIAKSEAELMQRLNSSWTLVQVVNDKFLLQKP
jgi:hypothetical protein